MPAAWEVQEILELRKEEREEFREWYNEVYLPAVSQPLKKPRVRRAPRKQISK